MDKNEAQTRRDIIDKQLKLAGWDVNDPSQVVQELDIDLAKAGFPCVSEPTSPYAGHQFADYGLLLHGKPMFVVEAKRTSKDAQLGKEQGLQYAQHLHQIHGGRIPFVSYTNGYDIFFWEPDFYPPKKVYGFPTRDDLEWLDQRRGTRKPLSVELINTSIVNRGYQIEGIRTLLEQIENKRSKFLMVMATGTGKTRTAVALIDVLQRAKWAKRVLFLVDRIPLQDQALQAFKEHMPDSPSWPKEGEKKFARDRRVYVTTYPTMLNLIQASQTPEKYISPFFFDLIVADESHRSIYNTYKQIVEYFNAVKIGLTATPTDQVEHDTFELFDCPIKDPSFAYSFEDAIDHNPPYLCNYEVLKVRSKFQVDGIRGKKLSAAIKKKLIAEGRDLSAINFEGTDLERKVTNSGTNAFVVREFMEECIKDDSGTLPGKSIIFAISIGHARRLQDHFDSLYPEHLGKLARVIVSEDKRSYGKGGLLDQFKNQDMPRVAISVDMLDTGVDVREVVNLVFAKPVYSAVKFWQMIGRGTRVLEQEEEKRKPWCKEKDKFLIIDCWENFKFFKMKPKGREPGPQIPLPVRLFRARLAQLDAAFAADEGDEIGRIKQDLRGDIADLPKFNVVVADHQKELYDVGRDEYWKSLNPGDIGHLRSVIAPIMRVRSTGDFKAMSFVVDLVELSTFMMSGHQAMFDELLGVIVDKVAELPLSVNVVAKERDLIEEILHPGFGGELSNEKIRSIIERIAPLMKYRQTPKPDMVKLDIADLLEVKKWVEVGPDQQRYSISSYRSRVENYIRALMADNPVLQKIQSGESVTEVELHELADLLQSHDPHITIDLLRRVYDHKTAKFLQFIRHILGLELLQAWEVTVTGAFEDFIGQHNTLTALQVRFLQTLRTFILQTGGVRRENLIKPPFTQIHPNGVRGVFKPDEITEILAFSEELSS